LSFHPSSVESARMFVAALASRSRNSGAGVAIVVADAGPPIAPLTLLHEVAEGARDEHTDLAGFSGN
jgi:hypothetical protein